MYSGHFEFVLFFPFSLLNSVILYRLNSIVLKLLVRVDWIHNSIGSAIEGKRVLLNSIF